jgi:hypothetical protein
MQDSHTIKIEAAKKSIASGIFNLSHLEDFRSEFDNLSWKKLTAFGGENMNALSSSDQVFIKDILAKALGIDIQDLTPDSLFSPHRSLQILQSIRVGQPVHELMWELSVEAKRYIDHLIHAHGEEKPVFKFLVGNPGSGKTTFRNLLQSKLDPSSPIIHNTFGAQTTGNTIHLACAFLFDKVMIDSAAKKLKETKLRDARAYGNIKKYAMSHNYYQVLSPLFGYAESDKDGSLAEFVNEYHNAVNCWIKKDTVGELKSLQRHYGEPCEVMPRPKESNSINFTAQIMSFYSKIGLYPVWLMDEFEAHESLYRAYRIKVLDYFRGFFDILSDPSSKGFCLIFSTEAGMHIIDSYPALSDRLSSGKYFSLTQAIWRLSALDKWNNEYAIKVIKELYHASAQIDDISEAVDRAISELGGELDLVLNREFNKEVARNRLTPTVTGLLDPLSEPDSTIKTDIKKIADKIKSIEAAATQVTRACYEPEMENIKSPTSDQQHAGNLVLAKENYDPTAAVVLMEYAAGKDRNRDPFEDDPFGDDQLVESSEDDDFDSFDGFELPNLYASDYRGEADFIEYLISFEHNITNITVDNLRPQQIKESSIFNFFARNKHKHSAKWPAQLQFNKKPLEFSGELNSSDLKFIISDFEKSRSPSSLAKKYARFRDLGGRYENLPLQIQTAIEDKLPEINKQFNFNLNLILSAVASDHLLPTVKITDLKRIQSDGDNIISIQGQSVTQLVRWNVFETLSLTRSLVYAYAFNSGYFPPDAEVDEYVLEWHEKLGMTKITPDRNGVFFYSKDGLWDKELQNIRNTWE